MREGLLQILSYRVVDQHTGAEIVNPLPHPHRSSWTVMAMLAGLPGGGTIGSFKLPLWAPNTEEYHAAKSAYDKLAAGQRIEAYLGPQAQGTPRFSGVLNQLDPKRLTAWEVAGDDSLWWLKSSLLLPQEQLPGTMTADQILARTNGTQEILMADDFSGGSSDLSTNYQTNAFVAATDPNFAHPAARWTSGSTVLIGKTSITLAQYQLSRADVIGTIVPSTDTVNAGELGVIVRSDATANNCVLGRCFMRQTAVGVYAVDVEIQSFSAGNPTSRSLVQNVFTGISSPFRCQVTMVGTTAGGVGTGQVWRVFLNGKDPAVFWQDNAPGGGFSGVRAAGNGSPTVYADVFVQSYRNLATPRFSPGTVSAGTITLGQVITSSSQSQLDLWGQAQALDGFLIRKRAGRGHKGDVYDFAANPGSDLSGSVRFEEGVNLEDCVVSSASEAYASDLRMTSVPGGDSGGSIIWPRIGSAGDMVLTDTVADVSIPGFTLLARNAAALQAVKVNPWLAKELSVVRDAKTADQWRELDYVMLHSPSLGISNQRVLVLGYTFTENLGKQTVYLDQYTDAQAISAERLRRAVELFGNTYLSR